MIGLIVEILLFIIKGSQIDAATERARKQADTSKANQRLEHHRKQLMITASELIEDEKR